MKVLILGSNGLLGQALQKERPQGLEVVCASRGKQIGEQSLEFHSIDLSDFPAVSTILDQIRPDCIINSAAYTHVDGCETDPQAVIINEKLPEFLSQSPYKIIHISTDYVHDGTEGPYSESGPLNPISQYGLQKLNAEKSLLKNPINVIVRTSLIYGPGKGLNPNFHDFVHNSIVQGKQINIVDDQFGNPTLSIFLAQGIWELIESGESGIYNIAGQEVLSRYDWALAIAKYYQLNTSLINKIDSKSLNQIAPRPLKSGLQIDKIQKIWPEVVKHNLQFQIQEYERSIHEKS